MRKWTVALVLVAAVSSLGQAPNIRGPQAAAQLTQLPALLNVPLWPESGVPSEAMAHQYVFLEPSSGDLVVSYPENLDTAEPGPRIAPFRVRLPNHVEPIVGVNIQRLADGRFAYTYRVRNGRAARDAITEWYLGARRAAGWEITGPPQWQCEIWRRWPGAEEHYWNNAGNVRAHWWLSATAEVGQPGAAIAPRSFVGGFKIVSSYRPGLVRAYFRGGTVVRESDEPLPKEVEAQLEKATGIGSIASRPALTLGPVFPPEEGDVYSGQTSSRLFIVEQYYTKLAGLDLVHKLNHDESPFMEEAISQLQNYMAAFQDYGAAFPNGMSEDDIVQFTGPPIVIHNPPGSPLEKLLYYGMRYALDLPLLPAGNAK